MNTYRGVDSEGSFNRIIGNKIFNLSGSYYEGNNGTDGGEGGIFASYDNTCTIRFMTARLQALPFMLL